jgi:hypothetical protein
VRVQRAQVVLKLLRVLKSTESAQPSIYHQSGCNLSGSMSRADVPTNFQARVGFGSGTLLQLTCTPKASPKSQRSRRAATPSSFTIWPGTTDFYEMPIDCRGGTSCSTLPRPSEVTALNSCLNAQPSILFWTCVMETIT